ncbi:TNT domain-containing protein [Haloactinomyces albus]|uniref:TNT domain-containing protein n=1 Tax=Haloactinomyces albus TaxID=1352928 RepID=A0AAE3ZAI6_9ACTN|nr:TNT domain-containing protein [Haloactinomyces albus]MDR7301326.1 hypothetical protein [Haloactinomyces albus]
MLHQFPIGHMPVAASRPSKQWSVPEVGDARASPPCFPPRDHPRSDLIVDTGAFARVRTGATGAGSSRRNPPPEGSRQVPGGLVAEYDPLGQLDEIEWERAYVARAGPYGDGRSYVWPASADVPEGGVQPGAAVVLDPGTVVDRIGDDAGRALAAAGTAFALRCLPPEHLDRGYHRYRVLLPLPVWQAITAPWFAQPGGGLRYRTIYAIAELVAMGYLTELPAEQSAEEARTSKASTLRIGTERAEGTGPDEKPSRETPADVQQETQ